MGISKSINKYNFQEKILNKLNLPPGQGMLIK